MIITCDVDGVLNNLMEATLEEYNKKYTTSYTLNDITTYNLENCFKSKVAKRMKDIFNSPYIWNEVKPVNGSQEGLEKLINKGHQVYLATDNNPSTYGEKVAWIKRFYPFIDTSKIICIKDKWLLRADVMIEDCLQNLLIKPYFHRILVDQPWNQFQNDWVYDIHRYKHWNEIVADIDKFNEEE